MPAPTLKNRPPLPRKSLAPLPPCAISPADFPAEAVLTKNEAHALLGHPGMPENADIRRLLRYHSDSADRDVPLALMQKAKALSELLSEAGLDIARAADSSDLMHMALWLYNLTGQRALLSLLKALKAQAPDWMSTLHIFPQIKAVREAPESGTSAYFRVHGKTIASSLKTPALQALFEGGLKNETAFSIGYEKLMRYHGGAHGLFHSNPFLSGANPSCMAEDAVALELLSSLHVALFALCDPLLGDIMEHIAFSAIPAMGAGQAANQLIPSSGKAPAHALDAFAASLWMGAEDDGLAAVCYAPASVLWHVRGIPVRAVVKTRYPYEETIHISLRVKEPARFALWLRIPGWANGACYQVDGGERVSAEPGTFVKIEQEWRTENEICLTLPMEIRIERGYHQSASVMRGPIAYALEVKEGTPWNMALTSLDGARLLADGATPQIIVPAAPVPAWETKDGVPSPLPIMPKIEGADVREIALVPYGATRARIAQFPVGVV